MQGHGYAQPVKQPPDPAVLVLLRVLFVAIGWLCIGFTAWVMLLRLAIVTRRSLDWGLLVAVLAADVLSIVLLAGEPGDEVHTAGGYLGITLLLGGLVATTVYYLAADIRHFQRQRESYPAQHPMAPPYGYARPSSPYTATTVPSSPTGTQPPHTPVPVPHTPPPIPAPPQRPAPARIEQVRAELDELSDYLRKHDRHGHESGHGHGDGHEGGR
ncbi:hypothetical protein [Streptomyces sp. NPDC086787]|uniref:hypothetical protein n=1 Tax=Streptomyces sp. NPDC086787 TaxID=3365759 RepID=UPI003828CB6D